MTVLSFIFILAVKNFVSPVILFENARLGVQDRVTQEQPAGSPPDGRQGEEARVRRVIAHVFGSIMVQNPWQRGVET